MHALWTWICAHPATLLTGFLIVVGSALNAASKIWGDYAGKLRWIQLAISVVAALRSLDQSHPIWGKFKIPGVPERRAPNGIATAARRLDALRKADTDPGCFVVLLIAAALSSCGSPPPRPRMCRHLDAMAFGAAQWTDDQCVRQQTKRDIFWGLSVGLAAVGAGGTLALAPNTDLTNSWRWRAAWIGTSVLATAASTAFAILYGAAQKTLSNNCVDYKGPPKKTTARSLLQMRLAEGALP